MALAAKFTHADEAVGKLAAEFQGKPDLEALIRVFADRAQDLENVIHELLDERSLAVSVGVQLDGIGDIVGEPRGGRDDATYREAIGARILLNISSGTPEQLIAIVLAIVGPLTVEIVEAFPAHFDLFVDPDLTPNPAARLPLTAYVVGDKRSNFGNAYVVVIAGTSAAGVGPVGTGAGIVDGTVTWNYTGPGVGGRMASLVLSGKPAGVKGIVHWTESALPYFGFSTDANGLGFDDGDFAQAHDF